MRVGTERRDELGGLATSIDRMASRLEAFVMGQKRFLGDIAHELRSPLGRMQIASEILERQTGTNSNSQLTDMKEDIGLMSDLTQQLLVFAKTDLKPDSVSLRPVRIANVLNRAANVERSGTADIQIDVEPNLMAHAESEYLFRAVSNLIRNSIRYAGDSGPIEVSARAEANDVLVTVADSGPGVPDDMVEKIFEPFFRVDTSRTRKTGGTGLGLAIVQACVEVCQGSIECRNRKPSGLTVTLRLAVAIR